MEFKVRVLRCAALCCMQRSHWDRPGQTELAACLKSTANLFIFA